MRRLKILKITNELFRALLLQDGTRAIKVTGIPADVVFNAFGYDDYYDTFKIRLESESFREMPPGSCIEEIRPEVLEVRLDITERDHIAAWLQNQGYTELGRQVYSGEYKVPVVWGDKISRFV